MKALVCKECGKEREVGRRLCKECNNLRHKKYVRYTWTKTCEACKLQFQAWRKYQAICKDCWVISQKLKSETINTNGYKWKISGKKHEHRFIAEKILGRGLNTNEVVHHVDGYPKNNSAKNLMVMDRRIHGKLHLYLDLQRVILEKSGIENIENCWKTLIAPMTTAWLETTSAKVIKLWEIGQSAAEPLNEKSYGEGSETMHDAPVTG